MAKVMIGVGAMALLVLGLLWLGDGASAPAQGDGVQLAAAPPVADANKKALPATPVERVEVASGAAAPVARPANALAGLRGRVVHADGRPVADCLVRVLGIDGVALFADASATGDGRTLPLSRGETRTGADGVFAIAGLSPCTRFAVNADADGPDRTLRLTSVTPFPDEVADLGDVVLATKASIRGSAVDDAGAPVAGAEVLALDLPAALAAALPFDRFDPQYGGMLTLPAPDAEAARDIASCRERLHDFLARQLFEHADIDRQPGLATLVIDRLPWLQALWQELPIARTTTAADGSFTLRGVEPGGNLLLVRKPGLGTGSKARVVVQPAEQREVGAVRLPAGEELRGVVRAADGAAVANAEVRIGSIGALGYRGVAFGAAPVTTDGSGAFRVTGLGRGRAMVAARRSAEEPWHVVGPVATDDDVELRLPARSELRLRLARADGAPLAGLALELFAGPHLHELRRAGLQQRLPLPAPLQPDALGQLSLGELPAGCYTLHVEAAGAMPADIMVALPQTEPTTIGLQVATTVLLRVRDASGQPIAGARVYVAGDDASARSVLPADYGLPRWNSLPLATGATDAAGELRLPCPATGAWLHATHPLHAPASAQLAAGAATVELTLPRPGMITGRLSDHGVPADPRRYSIVAVVDMTLGVPVPDLRAGLCADGTFAFPNVAPTHYRLHAEPRTDAPLSLHQLVDDVRDLVMPTFFGEGPISYPVAVAAGETATLAFDIDPNQPKPGELPARLVGRALIDGAPLAGAELQRRLDLFRFATLTTVAADGSFTVEALPPGDQILRLQLPEHGQNLWQGELTLQSGESRFLDLAMATGSARGTAAFASGRSVCKHVVTAIGQCCGGAVERSTPIGADGRFTFAALPAGDYTVAASGPDGKSEPLHVQIGPGTAAPPLHLELLEFPVLSGRIAGDFAGRGAMLFLYTGNSWQAIGLEPDGSFHYSDLKPQVYQLELQVDGVQVKLEPARFDLSLGSMRDVLVRAKGPVQAGK